MEEVQIMKIKRDGHPMEEEWINMEQCFVGPNGSRPKYVEGHKKKRYKKV